MKNESPGVIPHVNEKVMKKESRGKNEAIGIVRQISPFLETVDEQKVMLAEWFRNNRFWGVKIHEYDGKTDISAFITSCVTPETKFVMATEISVYGENMVELCELNSWASEKPYKVLTMQLVPETPDMYVIFTWELQAIQAEGRAKQRAKLLTNFLKHIEEFHERQGHHIVECHVCHQLESEALSKK